MSTSFASPNKKPRVAVIGAGAFGGWTALHLPRSGAKSYAGGRMGTGKLARQFRGRGAHHSRYIRSETTTVCRDGGAGAPALEGIERRWNQKLFHRTGVLWMASPDGAYEKASLPLLREAGIEFEELHDVEARKRFPQINFENVNWSIWEKESGFLAARRNCQIVLEHFMVEGGEYLELPAPPGAIQGGEMRAHAPGVGAPN